MTLDYSDATAKLQEDGSIICHHEIISEERFDKKFCYICEKNYFVVTV